MFPDQSKSTLRPLLGAASSSLSGTTCELKSLSSVAALEPLAMLLLPFRLLP